MDKKIKILFDGYVLAESEKNSSSRSGIFFTALNILKQLSKNENVEIGIYCSNKKFSIKLKETLKRYFTDNNFNEVYLEILTPLEKIYCELTYKYKLKKNFQTKLKLFLVSGLLKCLPKKKIDFNNLTKDYDVYFSPVYKIPDEIENIDSIIKYTLLHDTIPLLFPQYFKNENMENYWFTYMVKQINAKDYYFSNSEYTKNDFIKYIPNIEPTHIKTTLLACSEDFYPQKDKTKESLKKYSLPTNKKYIFSLCTLEPRKNLIRAVKSFIEFIKKNKINDMIYILGGGHWKGFIEQIEKEIPDFDKYRDVILKTGYIADEDLAPLYSGAEWFVYTSEYEGFGLPPLEAMSCGCPVITSDRTSLPEVVGDSGIMIAYDSEAEHIEAYEKYYFDKSLRHEYAQKGYERSKEFSWKKCTDIMVKQMQETSYSSQKPLKK